MAFSLNKIMLIGNLGQDAETRFTTNNTAITSFSVATTYSRKDQSGNWTNETTWHNVIAFSLSDFFKEKLKKGAKVFVEGRLAKRDYTNKEGVKVYVTEIVSEKIIPLDKSEETSNTNSDSPIDNHKPPVDGSDDLPF